MRAFIAFGIAIAVNLAVLVHHAVAAPYLPPEGQVWHGMAGGTTVDGFAAQTGKDPAVFQLFVAWGDTGWAFRRAAAQHGRLMLHLSTFNGPGSRERITPAQIAAGEGDAFLEELNAQIREHGRPVYVRLMAEMNGHWNPYSAFDARGRARPGHSTADFRRAWRHVARILRRDGAPVSLMWVPQVAGSPDTPGNAPRAYWPGAEYVDWVGTDFYSRFPNWRGLERFYASFRGKPFVFGEYAVWGRDDPAFVRRLFTWSATHRSVRMLVYNQGQNPSGPFRLSGHPRSLQTLRGLLRSGRYPGAPAAL
jgi:hypothetical protein